MPFTSNKLGRNATYVATANGSLQLTDFSVAYDGDKAGTVQLQGSNAIGTSTAFTTDFANGDFVRAVVNSTTTDVRVINQVVNATFMNVTTSFTAANASTTYGRSETVEKVVIDGVKFSSNGFWTVTRGANVALVLHGTDKFYFAADGQQISTDPTMNVVFSHSAGAGGTLVMEFAKKVRVSNNQVNVG